MVRISRRDRFELKIPRVRKFLQELLDAATIYSCTCYLHDPTHLIWKNRAYGGLYYGEWDRWNRSIIDVKDSILRSVKNSI